MCQAGFFMGVSHHHLMVGHTHEDIGKGQFLKNVSIQKLTQNFLNTLWRPPGPEMACFPLSPRPWMPWWTCRPHEMCKGSSFSWSTIFHVENIEWSCAPHPFAALLGHSCRTLVNRMRPLFARSNLAFDCEIVDTVTWSIPLPGAGGAGRWCVQNHILWVLFIVPVPKHWN